MSDGIYHGGDLPKARAQYGSAAADWIDLSTGINPWPYPLPDLPGEAWTQLPQPDAAAKLLALARTAYSLPDGAGIVAAPGTQAPSTETRASSEPRKSSTGSSGSARRRAEAAKRAALRSGRKVHTEPSACR